MPFLIWSLKEVIQGLCNPGKMRDVSPVMAEQSSQFANFSHGLRSGFSQACNGFGTFRVYSVTILAYYPSEITDFTLEQVTFSGFQFDSMFTKTSVRRFSTCSSNVLLYTIMHTSSGIPSRRSSIYR